MKRKQPEPDWIITLDDCSALKSVVEAVQAVMTRVTFKVCQKDGVYTLAVDGADVAYACCVSARLLLDNVQIVSTDSAEEFSFCVDCKHVIHAISDNSCAAAAVEIKGYSLDATVRITMKDPDRKSYSKTVVLSTYVDGESPTNLMSLDYKFSIEVDLVKLREMLKSVKEASAECLRIRIFIKKLGGRDRSAVEFSTNGTLYSVQKFCHDVVHSEDGAMKVRAAADGDDEDIDLFEFVIDSLLSFLHRLIFSK